MLNLWLIQNITNYHGEKTLVIIQILYGMTISINCRTFTKHKNIPTHKNSLLHMRSLWKWHSLGTLWLARYRREMLQDNCEKLFNKSYIHTPHQCASEHNNPLDEIQIGFFIPDKLGMGRHLQLFDYILKPTCSLIRVYYLFCSAYGHNRPE